MIHDEALREEISAIDNLTRKVNNTVESSMNYVLNEFMRNLFVKFSYYNTDLWDDVIPRRNTTIARRCITASPHLEVMISRNN